MTADQDGRLTDEQIAAARAGALAPKVAYLWIARAAGDEMAAYMTVKYQGSIENQMKRADVAEAQVAQLQQELDAARDEADDLRGRVLLEGAQPDSFPIGSEQFHAYMNVNLERLEEERDAAKLALDVKGIAECYACGRPCEDCNEDTTDAARDHE